MKPMSSRLAAFAVNRAMISPLKDLAARLTSSQRLRIARYFLAGVSVSIGYTVTFIALMEWLGWSSAVLANTVSFCLWTPVSYIVHRDFTFRYDGEYAASATKFGFTFVVKLLTSLVVVAAITEQFQWHYIFGILTNWIALPLVTYVALKVWVFRMKGGAMGAKEL